MDPMLKVLRSTEIPATLVKECSPGGRLTEAIKVYSNYFASLAEAGEEKGNSESIHKFLKYDEDDVREKLDTMFHSKCAYCESLPKGTGLMEIEHFRPKAKVLQERGGAIRRTGYYWLAWEWENLLPSCHNCNSVIYQYIVGGDSPEVKVLRGKGNLFPLADDNMRISHHENHKYLDKELPLLLNPCVDDPKNHLEYSDEGHIYSRSDKGYISIITYGLDRKELFKDRLSIATLITAQIKRVRRCMTKWIADPENTSVMEELIEERDILYAYVKPEREYSLMASQIIHRFCLEAELDCPCCMQSSDEQTGDIALTT